MLTRPAALRATLALVCAAFALVVPALPATAVTDSSVLTVTIATSDGRPAPTTRVEALRLDDDGTFRDVGSTLSAAGVATFELTHGVYRLWISDATWPYDAYLDEYHPDSATLEGAEDVIVTADRAVEVVLNRHPAISGRVTDSAGLPLAGAKVYAESLDEAGRSARATADPEGRFALRAFPGRWHVVLSPPTTAAGLLPGEHQVAVARSDIDLGDQPLLRPATISGVLVQTPPHLGEDPRPQVLAVGRDGKIAGDAIVSPDLQRYTITGLRPGSYAVYADADAYAPTYAGGETLEDATWTEVPAESTVDGPTISLVPRAPGVPAHVAVTGVVRDRSNAPLAGVLVRAHDRCDEMDDSYEATTDSEGRYYLTGMMRSGEYPRTYCLSFGADGDVPGRPRTRIRWSGGSEDHEDAEAFALPATGVVHQDAVLDFHAGLRGTVTAPPGGSVLFGRARAYGPQGTVQEVSLTEGGHFELDRLEPDVPYRVRVDATGRAPDGTLTTFATTWSPASPSWVQAPDGTFGADLDIPVAAGPGEPNAYGEYRVVGRLTAQGQPLRAGRGRVSVYLADLPEFGTLYSETVERSDGAFELVLPDGRYELYLTGSSYWSEWYDDAYRREDATVVVVDGDDVTLEPVDLEAVATVEGRAVTPSGDAIPGVTIGAYASRTDPEPLVTTRTGSAGTFSLDLPRGDWFFRATSAAHQPTWFNQARSVSVRTETLDLGQIALPPAGSVTGTVTWDGDPALPVTVTLFEPDGTPLETTTARHGQQYRFDHLPAGEYVVGFRQGSVDAPGAPEALLREFFPGSHSWGSAAPIRTVAGATTDGIDAHLEPRPVADLSTTEIRGVVTDRSGEPLRGVLVEASTTSDVPHHLPRQSSTRTDETGHYRLTDLDPVADAPTTWTLTFHGEQSPPPHQSWSDDLSAVTTWSGGAGRATDARIVAVDGAHTVVEDVTMRQRGTIDARVSGSNGQLPEDVTMTVVDAAGDDVASTAPMHVEGAITSLRVTGLPPGDYYLRFAATRSGTTWWPASDTRAGAVPVTVSGGEAEVVEASLGAALEIVSLVRPRIVRSGQVLRVDPGRWSPATGLTFRYEWFAGGHPLSTAPQLRATPGLAGSSLQVRVVAHHEASGRTASATTPVLRLARQKSTTAATALTSYLPSGRARRIRFMIEVESRVARPRGTVVVREHGRRVAAREISNATSYLMVARPRPGRHTYVIRYGGSPSVAPSTATITVRIKKPR